MAFPAVAIANEFLGLPGARGRLTQMHLQKLVYFSHGWNWPVNRTSLVLDQPQAWAYGPVYPDLYDHTKYFGKAPIGREITPDDAFAARVFGGLRSNNSEPYRASLNDRERQVIERVWERYGQLNAIRLSELTHQPGTPWYLAYNKPGKNNVLSEDDIRAHYDGIAARAAGTAH